MRRSPLRSSHSWSTDGCGERLSGIDCCGVFRSLTCSRYMRTRIPARTTNVRDNGLLTSHPPAGTAPAPNLWLSRTR